MPYDTLGDMFSQTGLAAASANAAANPPQAPEPQQQVNTGSWTDIFQPPSPRAQQLIGTFGNIALGGLALGAGNYESFLANNLAANRQALAQQEMALRNKQQALNTANTLADIMKTSPGYRKDAIGIFARSMGIDPNDPAIKDIASLASKMDDQDSQAVSEAFRQAGVDLQTPGQVLSLLRNPQLILQILKGLQEDKRLKTFGEAVQQLESEAGTPSEPGPQSSIDPTQLYSPSALAAIRGDQMTAQQVPTSIEAQDTPERRAALLVNAESNLKKAEDNFDRLTKLQARATKVLPPGPEREKYLSDLRLRVQAADSDRKHFDSQVTTITNQIETDKRTREFRQEADQRAREFHADTQANRTQLTEMQRQREEDRRQRELDKIVPGWFWDKTTGESRHDVTVGELRANKQNFHGMTQSQKDAHDLLVPAQKQIDGLRSLINRVLAANPGQQLYKIMQNYAKSKYQTDPDLTQLLQLSQSVALEQTRAVAGTTRPAIALFNAIQGKETPGISMTAEVANRVLDTTENNINNRLAQIRGEPLKDLPTNQPSGAQMPAGITVRRIK